MIRSPLSRWFYLALATGTIVIGLLVHKIELGLPSLVRDKLGDALWAAMILWLVSAMAPRARLVVRVVAACGFCYLIEASQLYHTPRLDDLRRTTLGSLVLGSDFDAGDLVAYTAGVVTAGLFARAVERRSSHSRKSERDVAA